MFVFVEIYSSAIPRHSLLNINTYTLYVTLSTNLSDLVESYETLIISLWKL